MDATRYPRAAAYLDALPDGLESFPQCEVQLTVFDSLREAAKGVDASGLPGALGDFFRGDTRKGWVPEVLCQAANLVFADTVGEAEFLQWSYDNAVRLYKKPVLRHLMKLLSPTLVVMGAPRRWNAVRRGTGLAVGPIQTVDDRKVTVGDVTGPPGLFAKAFCEAVAEAFRAGLDGAHGHDGKVELETFDGATARYRVSWRA